MKLLFVCTGNTCRSPMAEAIFNHMAEKEDISAIADSAGISAINGLPVSENAVLALKEMEIDLSGHTSKALTNELLSQNDKIICLTNSHKNAVIARYPEFSDKCSVLGRGIDDPYGMPLSEYRAARNEIMEAVKVLIRELKHDGI